MAALVGGYVVNHTNANTMASLARETAAATRAHHARLLALVLAAVAMFHAQVSL